MVPLLRLLCRGAALLLVPAAGVPAAVLALVGARPAALRLLCAAGAAALGLKVVRTGPVPPRGSLLVANHVGYLDILVLGATVTGRFVAKSEVAGWPALGPLARFLGTIFIERERPRAVRQTVERLARKLARGERILLFPEGGVNPAGRGLLAFRAMLFESSLRSGAPCVPVALCYTFPADPRVWGWIDEPRILRHLRRRVFPAGEIRVELRFGEPLAPLPGEGRKELAERARGEVLRLLSHEGAP
ncbi:MAG: 1-acyl-sn-glycerol-3-phosphate acyltransferase [Deltaproteobacteria bacterium]|nr:1-acyl-sn-glycerol-3-phosphate acyltransferase [Deltaproteobacteria bacterium]